MLSYDSNSFSTFFFVEIIRLRRALFSSFGVKMMVPLEDSHFQTSLQLHNCVMFEAKIFITKYFA